MGKLERITVTMPEEMAARLKAAVDDGSYATTSEIVREAVRQWTREQDRRDDEDAQMREILAAARAGGRRSSEDVRRAVLAAIDEIAAGQANNPA